MEEEKEKKGFFSKLVDIAFTSGEVENTTESTESISTESISAEQTSIMPSAPTQTFNIQVTGDGVFDKNFHDSLQQLIVDNNIPGIDYLEFNQALKGMAGVVGLNEATSFQSVFTTLKFGDPTLTKEKLVSAIDFYIETLKKEEQEFKSEMDSAIEKEVVSRRNEAEALNSENQELVKKLQEINETISSNQTRALQLTGEAADVEAKIGQTNKNFIATFAHVVSNLETDKMKINQLIKE